MPKAVESKLQMKEGVTDGRERIGRLEPETGTCCSHVTTSVGLHVVVASAIVFCVVPVVRRRANESDLEVFR